MEGVGVMDGVIGGVGERDEFKDGDGEGDGGREGVGEEVGVRVVEVVRVTLGVGVEDGD